MRIIGYTYEADYHCIACTQRRFRTRPIAINNDEHGVPIPAHDSEHNPIGALFSTDELPCDLAPEDGGYSPGACGGCHETIKSRS